MRKSFKEYFSPHLSLGCFVLCAIICFFSVTCQQTLLFLCVCVLFTMEFITFRQNPLKVLAFNLFLREVFMLWIEVN